MYTQKQGMGQDVIISAMKKLGYNADTNGVCFGITHMEIEAILIGQREEFEERIRLISREPDLDKRINKAKTNISIEAKKAKKEKRKPNFSEEDLKFVEVNIFFSNLMLYQESLVSSEWFSENIAQSEPLKVAQHTQSLELERQQGIAEVYSGAGIYNRGYLTYYLDKLAEILRTLDEPDNLAVQISSSNHAMLLSYDKEANKWNLFDPNQLLKSRIDMGYIENEIMNAFNESGTTAFNTRIYATKKTQMHRNFRVGLLLCIILRYIRLMKKMQRWKLRKT